MKEKLLKSFLLAVTLLVGTSAWAAVGDETTNASIDFSNAISDNTVAGTVNSMTLSGSPFEISGGMLHVGNGTGTVTIPDAQFAGTRDEIVITFDMYFGNLTSRNAGFYLYDNAETPAVIGALYCSKYSGTEVINSFGIDRSLITAVGSSKTTDADIAAATNKSTFEIHLNYASGTMYVKQSTNGTLKQTTTPVAMGSTNPLKRFVVQTNYNTRYCWFDNLEIKTIEGDYTVSSADYTVNWKCGNDVLKSETRTGDVGSSITLYSVDKENFTQGGKRYIYVSDDAEGKTVADGGTTVVNITMKEGAEYNYTVNAVDGDANVLQKLAEGSVFEDATGITVNTPWYILYNGTLYYQNSNQKAYTVESDGQVLTLTYEATETTNVVYYSEAENISGGDAFSSTITSNRSFGRFQTATKFTTLAPAKYKIYTRANVGNGNTGDDYQNITFSDGTNNLYQVMTKAKTNNQSFTSNEITLSAYTDIYVHFSGSSTSGLDYIYIQKTGDPDNVTATISSYGYATFASAYDLDFTTPIAGLTAYKAASATADAITLEEVTGKVKAGNGLVLKGTAGTYPIPITTGASTIYTNTSEINMWGNTGTTTETVKKATTGTSFVLSIQSEKVVFAPVINTNATLNPGQAALWANVDVSTARALKVIFADDEATAVFDLNDKSEMTNDNWYDLQGRRVVQPTKGLYIVNGRKVIVK